VVQKLGISFEVSRPKANCSGVRTTPSLVSTPTVPHVRMSFYFFGGTKAVQILISQTLVYFSFDDNHGYFDAKTCSVTYPRAKNRCNWRRAPIIDDFGFI
jgi:hypothetical protein